MQSGRQRAVISAALIGLAACAGSTGDVPTGEAEADLSTTCPNPKPNPGPCWDLTCDTERKAWDQEPKPAGTRCGNGTCDDSGNCILPAPPTVPTNVQILDRHPTSVTLAWNISANATHFWVSANGTFELDTTAGSAIIGGLNPSTQYCFTITAFGPGGSAASAPVCAYTGFYTPLYYYGTLGDRIPWFGQTPQIPARVERVMLAPQDLGGAGLFLVRPNGHGSDCTSGSSSLAISLLPGQAAAPFQVATLFGEANPPLSHFGFDFGYGGLWFGGCSQVPIDTTSPVWLEVNFVPASTVHVVSATYGANVGASGNVTQALSQICFNEVYCGGTVSNIAGPLPDPAPGQAKNFVATYTCGSDPTLRSVTVPGEAAFSFAFLECP